jgi:hypothetical protein
MPKGQVACPSHRGLGALVEVGGVAPGSVLSADYWPAAVPHPET